MRILPILFNTEMVQAIIDGKKTVTRRAVKYKYNNTEMEMKTDKYGMRLIEIQKDIEGETFGKNADGSTWHRLRVYIEPKAPYQIGDILYVRETWCRWYLPHGDFIYRYKAIAPNGNRVPTGPEYDAEVDVRPWSPSIHMPKDAARIWLRVTDVRAERLKDITAKQCVKEGVEISALNDVGEEFARGMFSDIWESTIKKSNIDRYGWEANPWVWVIEFERCVRPLYDIAAVGKGKNHET